MFIDLSVPLNEKTPVYPGDPATKISAAGVVEKDGYHDHVISIATHVGTHIDAPSHMLAGGKNLDRFPIEKFSGRGVYIKVDREFDTEAIKKVSLQEGDIVLFHTGMSERYHESSYFESYPAMPEDVAHHLVEQKVSMVGMDMCSPDRPPFPVHKTLLGGDVLIIENLTNLEALADREFRVHAFPVKFELDAAPVRVVAEVA